MNSSALIDSLKSTSLHHPVYETQRNGLYDIVEEHLRVGGTALFGREELPDQVQGRARMHTIDYYRYPTDEDVNRSLNMYKRGHIPLMRWMWASRPKKYAWRLDGPRLHVCIECYEVVALIDEEEFLQRTIDQTLGQCGVL